MQTTYRLKAKDISMSFLKSLKILFKGQEVEITIKSIDKNEKRISEEGHKELLRLIQENRRNAPIVKGDIDIRSLIDDAHNPGNS